MPLTSRWAFPVPQLCFPDYVFTSPSAPLPDIPILQDADDPEGHLMTYSNFRSWSKRVAAGLRSHGLRPGDRVLLFSSNTIYFPTVFMGIVMAGGIFTGANPTYKPGELLHQLQDASPKFIICEFASLPTTLEATKLAGMSKDAIFVADGKLFDPPKTDGNSRGVRHWSQLVANEEEGERFVWDQSSTEEHLNSTIALNYSSGTTGLPKGVEITHRNYIANTEALIYMAKLDPEYASVNARVRHLCFLPLYHAMAQTMLFMCMKRGNPVYLMRKFDFSQMLQNLQKFRITDLVAVPPIIIAMAKDPRVRLFDLSAVERASSAAAPISGEICTEFEKLWPGEKMNIKQAWGMTETTSLLATWNPMERSDANSAGSVGRIAPNISLKVVDENGNEISAARQPGEFYARGPNIMKGYWRRPDATSETLSKDGWLRTGDIGYFDEDGRIYIIDRLKEFIKVKGNQVAPAELEALLLKHEAIADAAVIGVKTYTYHPSTLIQCAFLYINNVSRANQGDFRDDATELPRAYIVLQPGKKASEEEIHQFVKNHLSRFKYLDGGIRFVDGIPKNPSGKILRKVIRQWADAEKGAVSPVAKL